MQRHCANENIRSFQIAFPSMRIISTETDNADHNHIFFFFERSIYLVPHTERQTPIITCRNYYTIRAVRRQMQARPRTKRRASAT